MKLGVIGGSGLYDIDGIEDVEEISLSTPFGDPSDTLIQGHLNGCDVVFLPRHGRGHKLLPGELNHRANIFALKSLGVNAVVSISAVGSFKENLAPGDIVLVDQFIDRTRRGTEQTFFGNGVVAHVGLGHPTCAELRQTLAGVIKASLETSNPNKISCHVGGTYLNMEGPAFSTLAESLLFKSWGLDVIGMTNFIEAKLAREAELCYQTVAMVTDYDCWHEEFGHVEVETIIATLMQNASFGKDLIKNLLPVMATQYSCNSCCHALQNAIITRPEVIPEERKKALAPLLGKYIS